MTIKIKDREIGGTNPCFIIAEAGVNHNGNIKRAKKLVDVAVDVKADAVKFQTYKSKGVVTDKADPAEYVKKNVNEPLKQIDLLQQYELDYDEFTKLKKYCDTKNIIFLSSPHSFDAIDFLDDLVPAFKFGSGDITNIPALVYAAEKQKPMILGTGMSTLDEVKYAVKKIKETGNNEIIVLHCTTNYPCPFEEVHMNAMSTMQHELDCLVGYSDHTQGCSIPVMARSMGACILEKHFTIDKTLPGPDHSASLEPSELKQMIDTIRQVEQAFGNRIKKPTDSELTIMKHVRKSIIAGRYIKKNSVITREMIEIKRPGTGIPPSRIHEVLEKEAKIDIGKDELVRFDMLK